MSKYNGRCGKNNRDDNDSHSFYQEIGSRTALIHRLMNRQYPAAVAEAIAFAACGNPLGGGNQNG